MKAVRVHLALTVLWGVLALPTMLWWRNSIVWVAFMSLYANIAGHWAAWEAAKAKAIVERSNVD